MNIGHQAPKRFTEALASSLGSLQCESNQCNYKSVVLPYQPPEPCDYLDRSCELVDNGNRRDAMSTLRRHDDRADSLPGHKS